MYVCIYTYNSIQMYVCMYVCTTQAAPDTMGVTASLDIVSTTTTSPDLSGVVVRNELKADAAVDAGLQYHVLYQTAGVHRISHCNTLHHSAAHCNTLRCTTTPCNTLQHPATLQNTPQFCTTLQHTLPRSAISCNTTPPWDLRHERSVRVPARNLFLCRHSVWRNTRRRAVLGSHPFV